MNDSNLHTLRAAKALLEQHGFTAGDLQARIDAAQQANADEHVATPQAATTTKQIARNKVTEARIVGTVESLIGTCRLVEESFTRNADGHLRWEDAGEGVTIEWDSMAQATHDGQPMFEDEEGRHVREDEIELVDLAEAAAAKLATGEELDEDDENDRTCGARDMGFICTRPPGHPGKHAAAGARSST